MAIQRIWFKRSPATQRKLISISEKESDKIAKQKDRDSTKNGNFRFPIGVKWNFPQMENKDKEETLKR